MTGGGGAVVLNSSDCGIASRQMQCWCWIAHSSATNVDFPAEIDAMFLDAKRKKRKHKSKTGAPVLSPKGDGKRACSMYTHATADTSLNILGSLNTYLFFSDVVLRSRLMMALTL